VLALAGCGGATTPPASPDDDGVVRVGFLAPCAMPVPRFDANVEVARACPADVDRARKLVEGDRVDVVLAYPDDEQGLALALYAETQADITFVDGSSALPVTTLDVQAANYYRFAPDRRQRAAGLGTYAYRGLGRRSMRLRTDDPYAADAFTVEFCRLGGTPGPAERVPVRVRVRADSAVARLREALRAPSLRDSLAAGLDDNRQAVVDVDVVRGDRVVATQGDVEQTFGGAFTDDQPVEYRAPCER
jgi:hypothetical protein